MTAILERHGLSRRFGEVTAVRDLSITVDAGEAFGLLGPNGAGKSTTIKMLTTLLPVTDGNVEIMGFDLVDEPAQVRQIIGYVPQLLSADGDLTGYENLLLSAKLYGIERRMRSSRIAELLDFM